MEAREPSKPRGTDGAFASSNLGPLVETGPTATVLRGEKVAELLCYLATANRRAVHARSK